MARTATVKACEKYDEQQAYVSQVSIAKTIKERLQNVSGAEKGCTGTEQRIKEMKK